MKKKEDVDFHSCQLYFNYLEDIKELKKDFNESSYSNKSEYLRDLVMLGLHTKNNVSIKEKEHHDALEDINQEIKLLSNSFEDYVFKDEDDNASLKEDIASLKNEFYDFKDQFHDMKMVANNTRYLLQECVKTNEGYFVINTKALGAIYNIVNNRTFMNRINKEDLESGKYDLLPERIMKTKEEKKN